MTLNCTDLIISQYRNSPKLVSLIDTYCKIVQADLIDATEQLALEAVIDTASGYWLDRIGDRIGLVRPGLPATIFFGFRGVEIARGFNQARFKGEGEDPSFVPVSDATYKIYLRAKGASLLTDGSQPSLSRVSALAYGNAIYLDDQNMSTYVVVNGIVDEIIILASQLGLFLKPAGVRMIILIVHPELAFGFEGQDDSLSFNQAPFIGVIRDA